VPKNPYPRLDTCLESVGISLLSEWDVLFFLYRHGTSLASAGQISQLLGYGKSAVGEALDDLVNLQLVQRSRSSQGVRLYRFAAPVSAAPRETLEHLFGLSENRSGRLLIAKALRERTPRMGPLERVGLHLAKTNLAKKEV
jgi:hypothetical protein